MLRKLVLISVISVISLTTVFSGVNALTYTGILNISCTGVSNTVDSGTFDRDNTGTGKEAVQATITDGAGTVLYSFAGSATVGDPFPFGSALYTIAPKYNPITATLVSLAGNGLPEQVVTVQQGNCAGLPTFGACLTLTAASVIGNMPFQTQAYWAPGKVSPGVMVNPGTYWVLGEDSTGTYYKILLSCQYLWVPVDSMQPSFQTPWSGQPLPTTNVE